MADTSPIFEDSDLSGLPDTNPGSGQPWIDPTSHAIIVGALGTFGMTQVAADARYLQLSGGTLTGNATGPNFIATTAVKAPLVTLDNGGSDPSIGPYSNVGQAIYAAAGMGRTYGDLRAYSALLDNAGIVYWSGRAYVDSPADAQMRLLPAAGTDTVTQQIVLGLGTTTTNGARIKRSTGTSTVQIRNGDDSAGASVECGDISSVSLNLLCQGRLTTETGVGVSTSDRTAQSTLYFTPFNGNRIALYDGSRWNTHTLTERSLTLSGLTASRAYDVFIYNNAGTLTLELSAAWNSDNITRTDAITRQDGVWVKGSDATRRYLGTIYTTGTSTTEDSTANRYVWNFYNQVLERLHKETNAAHTYASAVQREWNNSTAVRANCIVGFAGQALPISVNIRFTGGNSAAFIYPQINGAGTSVTLNAVISNMFMSAGFTGIARQGLNYLSAWEIAFSGTLSSDWLIVTGSVFA